jgi:hypothetical protein
MHLKVWLCLLKNHNVPCECEKTIEVYGTVISGAPVVVPVGCHHDIANGLRIRFLFDRPWYDGLLDAEFLKFCKLFLKNVQWSHWISFSTADWFHHLPYRRRKVLEEEDTQDPFAAKSWSSDIFVKGEAYIGKVWSNFKPRIIQCRKSPLQMAIGAFFYSLYKMLVRTFSHGPNIFSTSKNALQLGIDLVAMCGDGDLYEGDASNWDGTVTNTMLKVEKYFLREIIPEKPVFIDQLLSRWTQVRGKSQGVAFSCDWGRRSGDMWTSAFNTLLNILITNFIWGSSYVKGVFNGDDNYFVVQKGADTQVALKRYASLGLKMELVKRDGWRSLEFCSGRFYLTSRGVKWGLKPFRQLCKFGINFRRHSKKKFRGLLLGNAMSMLPIGGHIPIFGLFLRSIVRTARDVEIIRCEREEWQITDTVIDDIHPEEEERFRVLYGLSSDEYNKLRLWALNVHIDDFPMVLDDPLFIKCAIVDGAAPNMVTTHKLGEQWIQVEERAVDRTWVELGWQIVEDLCHHYLPLSWIFFGLLEMSLGSFYALPTHYFLRKCSKQMGFFGAVLIHYLFNKFVGTANLLFLLQRKRTDTYDGKFNRVLGWIRPAGSVRMPGVFTPVSDFLGISNNRVTDSTALFPTMDSVGGRLNHMSAKRSTKRSNNTRRVTTVVVSKQKTQKRARRGRKRVSTMHPYLLSKVNPFMTYVDGIKAPDSFGYPTGTGILRYARTLTVNSGGYIASAFTPYAQLVEYQPLSATGVTVTWAGGAQSPFPNNTALQNVCSMYRVVSWGVRVTADSSLTNSQGHVWVAQVPFNVSGNYPYDYYPNNEQSMTITALSEKYSITELAECPLIVPGKAFDDAIYRFRDPAATLLSSTAVESDTGWTSVIVYVAGAIASTTAINIEVVSHVEFLHNSTSLYGFIDTSPSPYIPTVMEQASRIEATASVGIMESAVGTVEAAANYGGRLISAASQMMPMLAGAARVANSFARLRGSGKSGPSFPALGWNYDEEKY